MATPPQTVVPTASPAAPQELRARRSNLPDRYVALYDGQCEICQACVSWLRLLDRKHQVAAVPIEAETLAQVHPGLQLDGCLQELHVIDPAGEVYRGWDGVAVLTRLFPPTFLIGWLGRVPPFRWIGIAGYRFVARNRYAVSKCRGGACRVARPEQVRRKTFFATFWSCYLIGLLLRLPLIVVAGAHELGCQGVAHFRTFRRRFDFLGGKLSVAFLGGIPSDVVPILFGELFTAIVYDGVLVDPGSPRMRGSLARHLRGLPSGAIQCVVATHHHEEHVGNLNWAARRLGVPLYLSAATARLLESPGRLPWVRAAIIGQPDRLEPVFEILAQHLKTAQGELEVLLAPGHCDDHIVLYDRAERVLIAGDAFMGSYFATPNPDVDSLRWIETLERLLALEIDVLVEGHGHIHTLRADIADVPGVVFRADPRDLLEKKLVYLRWLRQQIEAGAQEGLAGMVVEATCFPWNRRNNWESFSKNELIRLLSLGHFSRSELVRSFVRADNCSEVFPTIYETRFHASSELPDADRSAAGAGEAK
jgi:glyoxylase-like metal-dependent hydrolase (beta-lactamase superfamily II)/predicted DCC family thiol-disulfide oxidoreductase YuxK